MKPFPFLSLLLLLTTGAITAQAQDARQALRNKAIEKLSNLSSEEIREGHLKAHAKKQDIPASILEQMQGGQPQLNTQPEGSTTQLSLPADMRLPGEFEEVQAIVLTWPYFTLDTNNNFTWQWFRNLGPYYSGGNFIGLGPVTNVIDTLSSSEFPPIYQQLVSAIEPHAEVWLNIWYPQDSIAIKSYMAAQGTPLTNTRFFVNPGNSIWYRDCGPVGFYYGPEDSIAFLDFEYYGSRPLDNALNIHIGAETGISVYSTSIEMEGGNILTDGVGTLITTTTVYQTNGDTWGQTYQNDPNDSTSYAWTVKTPLTQAQVRDSLTHLFNLDRLFVFPALHFDGGTGHIDLYADMWDENTFVFTQHPSGMTQYIDINIVNNNLNTIKNEPSYHGTPYAYSRIPLPSKDDGSWYFNGHDYEQYTRTYSNHLFVNKAIIQPVYSDGVTGNVAGMLADLEVIRKKYPGYTVIPIDKRAFDGFGGSIHCITKQIPAENPLLILHDPIRGVFEQNVFTVSAEIRNRSGINNAFVIWRIKGGGWNQAALYHNGTHWTGDIVGNPGAVSDTIEYYITTSANNGKTMRKPMTAPDGFYTFAHGSAFISVESNNLTDFRIGEFYPNPATTSTRLEINMPAHMKLRAELFDVNGRLIESAPTQGGTLEIRTSAMPAGIYFVKLSDGSGFSATRRFVVAHQ